MRPSSDNRTFSKLRQKPEGVINGSSMRAADNWWFRSHLGCCDHPTFSPKIFHNRHIAAYAQMESTDFHRPDLGWWNIRSANALARGYFPDEAEYFGSKAGAGETVRILDTTTLAAYEKATERRELSVEYELPRIYRPSKGLSADCGVKVRPGESAKLGFEILGPAKNPTINGQVLPVTLETSADMVVSEDGEHWKAVRVIPGKAGPENRLMLSQREALGEGKLAKPLVLSGGTTRVTYASEVSGSRVTFVKHYKVKE